MRLSSTIFGLLLFGLLSCSPDNVIAPSKNDPILSTSFQDDPSISTLNGTWKVYCFENISTHTVEYKTKDNSGGKDIIVEFDDTKDPNRFSGIKSTNSFGGEFAYASSRQFKLGGVVSTLMGQPRWADEFDKIVLEGLYNDVTFIISKDMLRIYYDNHTKSVTLIKD